MRPGKWKPAGGNLRASGKGAEGQQFHVQDASAEPLLQRVDAVQKSRNGWRARCPACSGTSRKLSITECDGRVLVHCFAGCKANDVLAAVGLGWPDLHPPRHWPQSPAERESARRAVREIGLVSAIEMLARESAVIEAAGRQLARWGYLSDEDDARLTLAVERVSQTRLMLVRAQQWSPAA